MQKEEWFPLVDSDGSVIGKATRKECHSGSKLLHPVIHLHVFNDAGDLFLQKRSESKDIQPSKWDTAVGGHVDWGETVEDALRREAMEELGIIGFTPQLVTCYEFESEIERELVHTYKTTYNGVILPNKDEIEEGRFWTLAEVKAGMGKGIFTPNFEGEIGRASCRERV